MTIEESIVLGVLAVLSIIDFRKKQISLVILVSFGVVVLLWMLFQKAGIGGMLMGLFPGVVCLLLSYVTGESIGKGDGIVLCILGVFCGIRETVAVFGLALVFAALWAIGLLVLKRAGRKTELPFLPCVSLGYLCCVLW